MALKINVEDRLSTYPGRVVLTPVAGETNTYDMVRADAPVTEGTPINKKLFDSKADALAEDAIVYVSTTGSDDGDGSVDAPFKTIQKAVDAIPKHLGGHTATVAIDWGAYTERVTVKDFSNGRLVISRPGELAIIVGGIDIINSSFVETNIYQIERATGSSRPLFVAQDGSNVFISSDMILDGIDLGVTGMIAERNSHVVTGNTVKLTFNNCGSTATAIWCSFVSMNEITGTNNMFGMIGSQGGIVTYKTNTTVVNWSNSADAGGLVLTGKNSTDLSDATLDL